MSQDNNWTDFFVFLNLLTFLWETSSLSQSGLSVQQLALGAGGCHCGSPDYVPVIAERVPPARVPGGVLPQPPLGLCLETRFVDAVAGRGQPVAIYLIVDVFVGSSVVLVSRCKGITQILCLCWITRVNGGDFYVKL